ncbi:MAG: peptidoglycan DD-metalloendopeptidase family protein [Alphaproteobacteria bacterium]
MEVRPGDTLEGVLLGAGASPADAGRLGKVLRKLFDPHDLKPGQHVIVLIEPDSSGSPRLLGASIKLAKGRFVEATRTGDDDFTARRSKRPLAVAAPAADSAEASPDGAPSVSDDDRMVSIKRGDTLADILKAARVDAGDAQRAIAAISRHVELRSLGIGEQIEIVRGAEHKGRYALSRLGIRSKGGALVEVARRDDGSFGPPGTAAAAQAEAGAAGKTDASHQEREEIVALSKGGTLHSLLKARRYRDADIAAAAKALALSIDPTTLRWGQKIRLGYTLDITGKKHLESLAIAQNGRGPVVIARREDGEFGPLTAAPQGARAAADAPATLSAIEPAAGVTETQAALDQITAADSPAVYIEEQAAPRDAAYRLVVEAGDSLMNMLLREGVDMAEIDQAVRALRKIYNPRRLRDGQVIALLTDLDPSGALHLSGLSIALSEQRYVDVRRQANGRYKAEFARAPSFADRLLPEGLEKLYAGYPALAVPEGGVEPGIRQPAGEFDSGEEGGWSVLSWLGSIGDVLGRTGAAEAAAIDLAPEPKPNRALDLEERAGVGEEDPYFRKIEISKGDTLVAALTRGGASTAEAEAVVSAFSKVHNPRRLQVGQTLALTFEAAAPVEQGSTADDEPALALIRVSLGVSADRDIVIERRPGDHFEARDVQRPLISTVYKASGEISSSFYQTALSAGLSMDVVAQLTQIFSYDVDFQRGLHPGDRFEVLYERTETDRGDVVEQGAVLYAMLTVNGEALAFYRYEPPDGPTDYFDRNGRSVRKALLRTPIDGARISSDFGMRKHPILGYSKKHKGVDFAAPSGTPVYAAGDGVIEKIGWFSSYGKYVRIKHNDTYKTAYAHLKSYARGMKVGTRVRQGQVVAYVGTTGRSTGPHLHYEVLKHDAQVNPNGTKLPTGKQLAGKQLAQFKQTIDNYQVMFAQAETIDARLAQNALRLPGTGN